MTVSCFLWYLVQILRINYHRPDIFKTKKIKEHTFTQTSVKKQGFPQAKRVKILRMHLKLFMKSLYGSFVSVL